jgi:hypothetical protein
LHVARVHHYLHPGFVFIFFFKTLKCCFQIFKKLGSDCYRWRGDDEVNDRPVGKPQEEGMMNIAASFSLSKKSRFVDPVGKS